MLLRYSDDLIKAQIETEDLPDEMYLKTPIQRAVQLLKRYRDVYFENRNYRISSIVITTLAAQFYEREDSIFEAIDNIMARIKYNYTEALNKGNKFRVVNPVNPEEDFTDSWTDKHYESFFYFTTDFYKKWQNLKNSFETSKEDYIELFGEGVYKKSLSEQFRKFSMTSKDPMVKLSGLVLGSKAFTDSNGTINPNTGLRNGDHHNFGG